MLFHLAEVFQVQVREAINSRRNTKSKDIYGLEQILC
jgi:phenylacetate-coenzyme A ligase PaaK-like adenylate-forming protein